MSPVINANPAAGHGYCLFHPRHNLKNSPMEDVPVTHYFEHLGVAVIKFVLIAIVLPLLPVLAFRDSLAPTIALMTSTFLIEYGAAPIGIGMGLHPFVVLFVLTCIAVGVTLFLFDIFDMMGEHSERVARFLKDSGERARKSKILSKYGIYGLVPCVMTLGFYACPPVAWVFGWRRDMSIMMIMTGYIAVSVLTVLISLGIFDLLVK
ncbi:MAG: small multi-drug export protein [Methanoregula sp.]|nr:MAG: small multi-drug export protein [Methanoregula sp.]